MNQIFTDISRLFTAAGITDFSRLPEDLDECGQFAKFFSSLNNFLEAAKIQGFTWQQPIYTFKKPSKIIEMLFDENNYLILALRYKELFTEPGESGGFDIDADENQSL